MSKKEKMLAKIRQLGLDIPMDARIDRTYAGRNQRSCGAVSWFVLTRDGRSLDIGSQYPITDLLAAPKIIITYLKNARFTHLDPDPFPVRLTDFQKHQLRLKKQQKKALANK